MSILVTGTTGFIGGHLVGALLRQGRELVCVARPARCAEAAARVPGARWIPWDLAQPGTPPPLPSGVETVIHLAQSSAHRDSPAAAVDLVSVNCLSTARLLDHARAAGASRFILASSGTIYRRSRAPLPEDSPVEPATFYAVSKLVGEQLALAYRRFFDVAALRFFCVYGPGQRGRLIPDLLRRVTRGETVSLAGRDGLRINPLYVDDAVAVVLALLESRASGVFNAGGREACSIRELAGVIGEVVGRTPSFASAGDEEGDLVGDTSLIERTLGWQPRVALAAGLRRVAAATETDPR